MTRKHNLIRSTFIMLVLAISIFCMSLPAAAATVKLNKTNVTLTKGYTSQLKVSGTSKKVTWTSSNTAVATVSSKGLVKARKSGTAKIKAAVKGGKTYTCKVTVKNNIFTSTSKPDTVRVTGDGINLFVTKMKYSGNKLVVDGFFTNSTGKRVFGLKDYNIKLYLTLANGKQVLLANAYFNMDVNLPIGGYQYKTLTFSEETVNPKTYNLRIAKTYKVIEDGYYCN